MGLIEQGENWCRFILVPVLGPKKKRVDINILLLAQVSARKELIGHTNPDVEISNERGRLVANIVIAYNSILLSGILKRYQAEGNQNRWRRSRSS
jgi:hypothetical protein